MRADLRTTAVSSVCWLTSHRLLLILRIYSCCFVRHSRHCNNCAERRSSSSNALNS